MRILPAISRSQNAEPESAQRPGEPLTTAQRTMARETAVSYGHASRGLTDEPLAEMCWQMSEDEFLLRGEGEHYFHYQRGRGITIERGAVCDPSEEALWLNGSIYSAIASLNGLTPIHASAVAFKGRVFAFTGPGGAGKSTLAAALGRHGLAMFCDDTLVLDLSDPSAGIVCLPGHKRLKLRPDALELTGATAQEKVSETVEKFYAEPVSGTVGAPLPLAELLFLEDGQTPQIKPIKGAERFARMQDDHQTASLFAAARRFDRPAQFAHLGQLATEIRMSRFIRPVDATRFHEGVEFAAAHIARHLEAKA